MSAIMVQGGTLVAGERTGISRLRPVERELRFALPFWAPLAVAVNDDSELPDTEGRPTRRVVLNGEAGELSSVAMGVRIEKFRSTGAQYLVLPSEVYPWLDKHRDVLRYLRARFRRVPTDEAACHIFALEKRDGGPPETAEDGLPIPPREMIGLVAGGLEPRNFFWAGRFAATWIAELLERNGIRPRELDSLLDFGCGCGRVVRHWRKLTPAELHGCDYNPRLVEWCTENLPFGTFEVNALEPPLPFPDNAFDFLYSLSIFTHLDEPIQMPWMEEVTRVVKPGGVFLLTFHGRGRMEEATVYEGLTGIADDFNAGKLVVMYSETSGSSHCAVYHPERYVREVMARDVEIVDYAQGGALDMKQDAVLFRKPARKRARKAPAKRKAVPKPKKSGR